MLLRPLPSPSAAVLYDVIPGTCGETLGDTAEEYLLSTLVAGTTLTAGIEEELGAENDDGGPLPF